MEKLGSCPCKEKFKELLKIGLGYYEDEGLGTPGFDEPILIKVKVVDENFYPVKNVVFECMEVDTDSGKYKSHSKPEIFKTNEKGEVILEWYMFSMFRILVNNKQLPFIYNEEGKEHITEIHSITNHTAFKIEGLELNKNTGAVKKFQFNSKAVELSSDVIRDMPIYEIKNIPPSNGNNVNTGTGNTGNTGTGNNVNTGTGNTGNTGTGNNVNTGAGNTGNTGTGNNVNTGAGNTGNTGTGNTVNTGTGNTGNTGTGNNVNNGNSGNWNTGNTGTGSENKSFFDNLKPTEMALMVAVGLVAISVLFDNKK